MMMTMMSTKVMNVPTYAVDYRYWVVTTVEDVLWFYGAWDDEEQANLVAAGLQDGALIFNG